MSEKHTPGPWTAREMGGDEGHVVLAGNVEICEVFGVREHVSRMEPEALANLRLLAAAPDMLAALHEIATEADFEEDDMSMELGERLLRIAECARTVAARAEGRAT